jgi:hypothetical protein
VQTDLLHPLCVTKGAPPQAVFGGYLDLWSERQEWMVRDKLAAARTFAGLLKTGMFDQALLI